MNMPGAPSGTAPAASGAVQPGFSPSVKMLIGTYERKLDAKLRTGLPHQFRDRLGEHPLIMIRWFQKSLAIFPECNWLPYAEAIANLNLYTSEGMAARHRMFAYAREVSMDKEGRIIIPQDMVQFAKLEKNIFLLGDWDKITVWSQHYYEDQMENDNFIANKSFPEILQMAQQQHAKQGFDSLFQEMKPDMNGE
jgi:MraZ protein